MSGTIYKIQHRRGTMAEWSTANPILGDGELGKVVGTSLTKMGDGISPWLDLPYLLTQDDINNAASGLAPINSPAFTGNPMAPTPPLDDNDSSIATSAFVMGQASASAPPMNGSTPASGVSKRWSRGDHVHPRDTGLLKKTGDFATGPLSIATPNGVAQNIQAATYKGALSGETGYLLITLPFTPSLTMCFMRIKGFNFTAGTGEFQFDIGGYLYQNTPAWTRYSSRMAGRINNPTVDGRKTAPVAFLHKGAAGSAQFAIAIGASTTVWDYPQISLEFFSGFSGANLALQPGFTMSIVSSLSGWTTDVNEVSPSYPQSRIPLPGEVRLFSFPVQTVPNGIVTQITGYAPMTGDKANGATTLTGDVLTLEEHGYWDVSAYFLWSSVPNGYRQADLQVAGTSTYRVRGPADATIGVAQTLAMVSSYWSAGTTLNLAVSQNSGSPVTVSGRYSVRRVGEYY